MIVSFTHNGATYSNWDISKEEIRQQLGNRGINLIPIAQQEIKKQFLKLEKQRINQILDQYGYNGLGDVLFYVSQNDSEAQALQNWYKAYDDAVWNFIENQIPTYTDINQLLEIDLETVEEQIFNEAVANNPLP